MTYIYDDGGRSKYFKGEGVGDCVTRAICNATGKDYKEVYDSLNSYIKTHERLTKRHRKHSTARDGVFNSTVKGYIENELGWIWHSTMSIGSGCTTHLNPKELPHGTIIIKLSHHLTCMKNGEVYDTFDPSRDGSRCVYGYWTAPSNQEMESNEKSKKELALISQSKKAIKEQKNAIRQKYNSTIGYYKKQIAKLTVQRDKELKEIEESEHAKLQESLSRLK